MQAQGLDSLESNVGEEYAHGGIIGDVAHFDKGGKTSQAGDLLRAIAESIGGGIEKTAQYGKIKSEREEAIPGFFEALTPQERDDRLKKAALLSTQLGQVAEGGEPKTPYPQGGKPIPGNYDRPTGADDAARETNMMLRKTPGVMDAINKEQAVAPTKKVNPSTQTTQTQTRVNADSAPMPAGLKDLAGIPSIGVGRSYERDRLKEDPAKAMADMKALYDKEVGQRDLSIYDQMAEELRGRKERLNAPKAGYDATMELLEQIAAGGGRNWMEAGSRGVAGQRALQKDRLSQQDLLMEKILDLGAKKSDALFAEKKGMFDLTQGEKNRIIKDKQEIAKSLGLSEDNERRLIEEGIQKELDRKNEIRKAGIAAQDRDQLMNRARALMAVDKTLGLEEAMKRAALAAGAPQMEGLDVRRLGEYNKAVKEIQSRYLPVLLKRQTPDGAKMRADLAVELAQARANAGLPPEQGINTLPTSTGLPPGVTVEKVK